MSLRKLKSLQLTIYYKLRGYAAIRTKQLNQLIGNNAPSMQTVRLKVVGRRFHTFDWVHKVPLPHLKELVVGYDKTGLSFLVLNSPLLEKLDLHVDPNTMTDEDLSIIAELHHLQRLKIMSYQQVTTAGILSLLRGRSRHTITIIEIDPDDDEDIDLSVIDRELDAIEGITGRRPQVHFRTMSVDYHNDSSHSEESEEGGSQLSDNSSDSSDFDEN